MSRLLLKAERVCGYLLRPYVAILVVTCLVLAIYVVYASHASGARGSTHSEHQVCCSDGDSGGVGASDFDGSTDAVTIPAGTSLSVRVAEDAPFASGGQWSTEQGQIDADGNYTAPSYTPPYGTDTVMYNSPDDHHVEMTVRIQPNPNIPGSGDPKIYSVPASFTQTTPIPIPIPGGVGMAASGWPVNPPGFPGPPSWDGVMDAFCDSDDTNTPVLEVGQTYAPPVEITDVEPIVAQGDPAYYPLPAMVDGESSTGLIALVTSAPGHAVPSRGKTGRYNPLPPWYNNPCNNDPNTYCVPGQVNTWVWKDAWHYFDYVITAQVASQVLKYFGIQLSVGAHVQVGVCYVHWGEAYYADCYQCVDGHWKFVYRKRCRRIGEGELTHPDWYASYPDGYPRGGSPAHWTQWACVVMH